MVDRVGRGAEEGPSDAELLARAHAGDEAAFELVFQRHAQSVYAYLHRSVGDAALAADLRQEAFIRLWRAAGSWTGQQSARPFLIHTARGLTIDSRRRSSVRLRHADTASAVLHSEPLDPGEVFRRARLMQRVEEAIATLPPRAREVFVLKRDAGLSYREIGQMLGISPKTVEVHMTNALRALRRELVDLRPAKD